MLISINNSLQRKERVSLSPQRKERANNNSLQRKEGVSLY